MESFIRNIIRQKVRLILEAGSVQYTLSKSDKKEPLPKKDTNYYFFNIVNNKKKAIGEYKVSIPSGGEGGDVIIRLDFYNSMFPTKSKSQSVKDTVADLIESIEDDIRADKFISKIIVKGAYTESEKTEFYNNIEMSFKDTRRSSSGNDLVLFLATDDKVASGIKDKDVMGRDVLKFKGQPPKNRPRKQVKQATTMRKRKPKPKSNDNE